MPHAHKARPSAGEIEFRSTNSAGLVPHCCFLDTCINDVEEYIRELYGREGAIHIYLESISFSSVGAVFTGDIEPHSADIDKADDFTFYLYGKLLRVPRLQSASLVIGNLSCQALSPPPIIQYYTWKLTLGRKF